MLLTLDLSTNTGWTLGKVPDRDFSFGHYTLPKTGPLVGIYATNFHHWLLDTFRRGVTMVVFESPILPKTTSLDTCRKLYGLAWHTEWLCQMNSIDCEEINNAQTKRWMGVKGRGDQVKKDMIAAAQRMGFDVKTHDEADAVACRLTWLSVRYPAVIRSFGLDLGMLGIASGKA